MSFNIYCEHLLLIRPMALLYTKSRAKLSSILRFQPRSGFRMYSVNSWSVLIHRLVLCRKFFSKSYYGFKGNTILETYLFSIITIINIFNAVSVKKKKSIFCANIRFRRSRKNDRKNDTSQSSLGEKQTKRINKKQNGVSCALHLIQPSSLPLKR